MMNSLSARLTYRIMAVVLAMMAFVAAVVYFNVREYMLDEAKQRYRGVLLKTQEEFRWRLSDVSVAAKNNVHDIERDIDHPERMAGHMERIITQNQSLDGCGLLFMPDYYPEMGRFFVPYATRDSMDKVVVKRIDSIFNNYQNTDWYLEGKLQEQGGWCEPYLEKAELSNGRKPRLLDTYVFPILDRKGQFAALLCADISLDTIKYGIMDDIKLMNEMFEKNCRHHSYCFVIDHKGTYVIHPNQSRMLNNNYLEMARETSDTQDDRIVASMVKGEDGSAMMTIDGVPSWIFYLTIKKIGWTIVLVVPDEVIFYNGRMLNIIILLTMFAGLLAIYLFCRHQIRKTTKPLHSFALSTDQVALGNFSSPLPEIKGSDEVRMLHDAFANMQTSLSIYVDELRKTTAQKASLESELKIANDIQMAMLPKDFIHHTSPSAFDLYAKLSPAREVGGDLYDYFLRDNRLFFCIGDVSGKSVPAALMMAVMRAMFRSETRRADSAEAIVNTMNRNLSEEYTAGYFVTMFVGVLDLVSGRLNYCNAGHEAPLIAGQPLNIKHNLPVGALSEWNFVGLETQLKPGDMLFLYTDGLNEANNTEGKQLGRKRVCEVAGEHTSDTPRQLIETMEEVVRHHVADAEQSDDITMLAIRWQQSPHLKEEQLGILSMKASMDDISRLEPFITDVAERAGIGGSESKRLRLAVEEAVANVINYGQAADITLQATLEDNQLVLSIDDDGQPFDPTAGSSTDLSVPADQRPLGGLGIVFLHKMTDGLGYQRINGHNILKINKKINPK